MSRAKINNPIFHVNNSPPPVLFTVPVLVDSLVNLENSGVLIPDGMLAKVAGSNQFKVGTGDKSWSELEFMAPLTVGSGLGFDSNGNMVVDFSQMPTDKFENLLKQLRLPIWLTKNTNFYVDGTNGSDVLSEERGLSADKAFKTISACINYICNNYNFNNYEVIFKILPGIYNEKVTFDECQGTGGRYIYFDSYDPNNPITIYHEFSTNWQYLAYITGKTWVFRDINFELKINANSNAFNTALINIDKNCTDIRFFGCNFKFSYIGKRTDSGILYNNLFVVNGTASIFPSQNFPEKGSRIESFIENKSGCYVNIFKVVGGFLRFHYRNGNTYHGFIINGQSDVFVDVETNGLYQHHPWVVWSTETGFTGKKFVLSNKGTINVNGSGTNYLPGDIAGDLNSAEYCIYK